MQDFLAPELVGTVLTGLISVLSFILYRYTGIKIEEKYKRDLHDALMSGAMSAVEHGPSEAVNTLKIHAIRHAQQSVPEAIRKLIPGDTVLDNIAARYVSQALSELNRRHGEPR